MYHAVAEAMTADAPDTLILCAPDRPHFCVGYHQDARQALDMDWCSANGYPILRRRVGGGATYLDANQLYYQLVVHHRRAPAMLNVLYKHALTPPVQTLRALGLDAELQGINELVVSGKRIAGIGAGRIGEATVVVGNFLFDFDYDAMSRAWQCPDETYRRLAREGLQQYVTTLQRELGKIPPPDQVRAQLLAAYAAAWGRDLAPGALSTQEQDLTAQAEAELGSTEWLFEITTPPPEKLKIADGVWIHHASCYVLVGGSDGLVNITARTKHNVIDALVLEPRDTFGGWVWSVLADSFVGLPLERDALMGLIDRYINGGIVPREVHLQPIVTTLVKMRV